MRVIRAWKDSFPGAERKSASSKCPLRALAILIISLSALRFIADDKGAFTGAIGMLFDATARLGSPRSKVRMSILITVHATLTHFLQSVTF